MRKAPLAVLLLALPWMATPAHARGGVPVYRDPPSYRGTTKVPRTAPPPVRPAVPLSSTGVFPDALVDEAGTAHIVWNEGRGNQADAAIYCRLKRGASHCDTTATLTWDKTYNPCCDGPQYNTDDGGPRIVRVGNQLIVFSKRYPTAGVKPDGTSSSTVVAWASIDGGSHWSSAAIVGKWNLGQLTVFGPPSDPTILNLGQDPLCGGLSGMCVEAYKSGQYSSGASDLSTASNQAYNPTLALDGGLPVAAFSDLTNHIVLRKWRGTGSVTDPGQWTAQLIGGDEPRLAGGPAGLHLMSKAGFGQPFRIQRLTPSAQGLAPGRATTVSPTDVSFGRIVQDPTGRVLAAWQEQGSSPGVRLRVAGASAGIAGDRPRARAAVGTFGAPQLLVPGASNGQISLSATSDGGGFAVLNHTGGVNGPGQIVATGFGAPTSTGHRGLGNLRGGSSNDTGCQKIDFGKVDIVAEQGCFLHGTGANASETVTGGEIDLYGLKIVPDAGVNLVIDSKKLRIDATGQVRVLLHSSLTGDITLWHGDFHRDLSAALPGQELFNFDIGTYAPNILGFDIAKNISVKLTQSGVEIPISLKLPKGFGGASADAKLIADRAVGLHVDSLHVHLGPVSLGVVQLNRFDLTYTASQQLWAGSGKLTIAGTGAIDAAAQFQMGRFKEAHIYFEPPTPILVGPFVYLIGAGVGFGVDPTLIELKGKIGAGVAAAGKSPITIEGTATVTVPDQGPAELKIAGKVSVAVFKLAEGQLRFQTDGYADFNVKTDQDFEVLRLKALLEGFVDKGSGQWGGDFHGEACLNYGLGCLGGSLDAAASQAGLAICGEPTVAGFSATLGVQLGWNELDSLASSIAAAKVIPIYGYARAAYIVLTHIKSPCHTDSFRVPPPRAARDAAAGRTISVPGGLPTETVIVQGNGAVPAVDLVGPGATVPGPAAGTASASGVSGTALSVPAAHAVMFVLKNPRGGRWLIRPRAASPAITDVRQSNGYRAATARATVTGRSRKWTLHYSVSNLGSGQLVSFVERSRFGARTLGKAKGARGKLVIRPSSLPAGRRNIYSEVVHGGLLTDRRLIASYVAVGPPRLAAVTGLRVTRRGRGLTVAWRPSRGAFEYLIRLRGRDGTRVSKVVPGRTRRQGFISIRRDERITVEVIPLSIGFQRGVARRISSAGATRYLLGGRTP